MGFETIPSDDLVRMAEKATLGGIFLFVGNSLATFILAIGSIIIARLLGPSSYAFYKLTFIMPVLFADVGVSCAHQVQL